MTVTERTSQYDPSRNSAGSHIDEFEFDAYSQGLLGSKNPTATSEDGILSVAHLRVPVGGVEADTEECKAKQPTEITSMLDLTDEQRQWFLGRSTFCGGSFEKDQQGDSFPALSSDNITDEVETGNIQPMNHSPTRTTDQSKQDTMMSDSEVEEFFGSTPTGQPPREDIDDRALGILELGVMWDGTEESWPSVLEQASMASQDTANNVPELESDFGSSSPVYISEEELEEFRTLMACRTAVSNNVYILDEDEDIVSKFGSTNSTISTTMNIDSPRLLSSATCLNSYFAGPSLLQPQQNKPTAEIWQPSFDQTVEATFESHAGPNQIAGHMLKRTTPSASDLIHGLSGQAPLKVRIPRGLQRILTQTTVEHLANEQNYPVPVTLDADVSAYFNMQSKQPAHALKSFSTPANVNIQMLGDIRITSAEIMAFFPNHVFKWADAMYRLAQNHWMPVEIAGYINFVRQLSGTHVVKAKTVRERIRKSDAKILGKSAGYGRSRPSFRTTCFTAKNWIVPKLVAHESQLIDYFLVDLAEGVVNSPSGSGARILTRAIEFALRNGFRNVRLSEVHWFIRNHNIGFPLLPPMAIKGLTGGQNPDMLVRSELEDKILEDIKRVKRSAKAE